VSGDGIRYELKYVAVLLAASFDGCQQCFDEPTAGGALGAEGEFAPDDRVMQRPLRRVVGRFDSLRVQEYPEPFAMFIQLPTHADQSRVLAENSAQQQAVDLAADRLHLTLKFGAGDRPVPAAGPVPKQFLRQSHQVVSQPFDLVIRVIDQGLTISFQMRPTPLQAAALPVSAIRARHRFFATHGGRIFGELRGLARPNCHHPPPADLAMARRRLTAGVRFTLDAQVPRGTTRFTRRRVPRA